MKNVKKTREIRTDFPRNLKRVTLTNEHHKGTHILTSQCVLKMGKIMTNTCMCIITNEWPS